MLRLHTTFNLSRFLLAPCVGFVSALPWGLAPLPILCCVVPCPRCTELMFFHEVLFLQFPLGLFIYEFSVDVDVFVLSWL